MTPLEWFQSLYGECPPGLWLVVNTKRDAGSRSSEDDPFKSQWFQVSDLERAAKFVASAGEVNVYFGLGLRRERLSNHQRGAARDVGAIPGLWVEIDVAGGTHAGSKKPYFETIPKVREFLATLPIAPSTVVCSGNGLHVYWLFREPWVFDGDDDRGHAAAILRGWQAFIRGLSKHAIDSTHDLARVLRVPGTQNRKNGSVLDVEVLQADGRQYSPSDFEEWILTDEDRPPECNPVEVRDEAPKFKIIEALREDRKFKATMDRDRKDLSDQSPSAYCASLACQLAASGWGDQDITDFLVWWRKENGFTSKPPGWYRLTIDTARKLPRVTAEADKSAQLERATTATEPEERLAALSALLGFRVFRIVRHIPIDAKTKVIGEPRFRMETELGNLDLTTEQIRTRSVFENEVFGKLGRNVQFPAKMWPQIPQVMADSWVTQEAPEEETPGAEIRELMRQYAEKKTETEDPLDAYDSNHVLVENGLHFANSSCLVVWLRRRGMNICSKRLARLLTAAGVEKRRFDNLNRRGKRTSLTFWKVD